MQNVILFCHIFGKSRQKLWFFSRLRFWICKNKTFLREYFLLFIMYTCGEREDNLDIWGQVPWDPWSRPILMGVYEENLYGICNNVQEYIHKSCKKHNLLHSVWKSQKKSHSTLRAKRAMITFWLDKSSLKCQKPETWG